MAKKIIVLVGASGSGKTTIGKVLTEKGIKKLTTTTTRPPRYDELDGVDYYFKNKKDLEKIKFVEQTNYNNNTYGLTEAEVEDALANNDIVHVSLDRNGSKALKNLYSDEAYVVFISITIETMVERMKKRGESEETIQERVDFSELTGELEPPAEADLIIENHSIEESVEKILKAVKKTVS